MSIKTIVRKVIGKVSTIKVYILYFFCGKRIYGEQLECKNNWIFFNYLKKKYNKKIKNIPKYTSTNICSNKVWWCWFQGEENAPELNKACLNSLRRNLVDKEIIVITADNYKEYIDIPEFIVKKYKEGVIPNAHFSDIMRTELLIKHGGTWIDSSVLCTENYEELFEKPLFVFQNWKKGDLSIVCSSWFITSDVENPILKTTRDLLYDYWKNHNYLIHYFTFHFFFTLATEKYEELWNNVDRFSNMPPHILQFELTEKYRKERFEEIMKMSPFHKLNQKLDFSNCNGDTNYDYILREYGGDNNANN